VDTQPLPPALAPAPAEAEPEASWRAQAVVLNPAYQAYVRGTEPAPAFGVPLWSLLFLLIMAGFGVYWIVSPIGAQIRRHTLETGGMAAPATVTVRTEQKYYMGHGNYATAHYMYYLYNVTMPDGLVHQFENRADLPSSGGPQKGAIITIRYLPDDPATSFYPGELAPSGWGGLIQIALGLLLIGITVGSLGWMLWRWGALRLLARGGRLVPGTIAGVGPAHHSRGYYYATVTVTFTSPTTGRRLIATDSIGVTGPGKLPRIGRVAAVLYESDTRFRVL
jgi:hypothetical protein